MISDIILLLVLTRSEAYGWYRLLPALPLSVTRPRHLDETRHLHLLDLIPCSWLRKEDNYSNLPLNCLVKVVTSKS